MILVAFVGLSDRSRLDVALVIDAQYARDMPQFRYAR